MAARRRTRKATKRKNNDIVKLETSVEIKEECTESIYFKMDCNNTLHTHMSKKTKLGLKQIMGKADGSSTRLDRSFYDQPAGDLAKKLLGKLLYRVLDNGEVSFGRIVETEAYLGEVDKACHSYGGKRIGRCEPLYMAPGTAYVYVIYGMYHCLNVSSQEPGACVLIRALEPLQGFDSMKTFRGVRRRDAGSKLKDHELCNGPSKLCQALNIEKANLNKEDMITSNRFWIEDDKELCSRDMTIVNSARIGIHSYGPEWALKPLRFYILGNKCVSVRDKKSEGELSHSA